MRELKKKVDQEQINSVLQQEVIALRLVEDACVVSISCFDYYEFSRFGGRGVYEVSFIDASETAVR